MLRPVKHALRRRGGPTVPFPTTHARLFASAATRTHENVPNMGVRESKLYQRHASARSMSPFSSSALELCRKGFYKIRGLQGPPSFCTGLLLGQVQSSSNKKDPVPGGSIAEELRTSEP